MCRLGASVLVGKLSSWNCVRNHNCRVVAEWAEGLANIDVAVETFAWAGRVLWSSLHAPRRGVWPPECVPNGERWGRRPEGVCGRAGAILPTFCVLDRRRRRVAIGFSRTGRSAPFLWHNVFRRMAELVAIGWCGRSGAALIGHFVIADCRRKNSFRWACALARTVSRLPESRRGHRGSMSSRR